MANLSPTTSVSGRLSSGASATGTVSSAPTIAGGVSAPEVLNGATLSSTDIDSTLAKEDELSVNINPAQRLSASLTVPETRAGGTNDYEELINKPKINQVTLIRNKSFEELGLLSLTNMELEQLLQ